MCCDLAGADIARKLLTVAPLKWGVWFCDVAGVDIAGKLLVVVPSKLVVWIACGHNLQWHQELSHRVGPPFQLIVASFVSFRLAMHPFVVSIRVANPIDSPL